MGVVKMDNMAKNKKGYMLPLALVIMTVGAIIIVALLNHLNTSLSLASKSEERAITYYAADSGFEDAFFFLQQGKGLGNWTETAAQQWERDVYEINDRTVAVSIVEDTGNQTYKITSTATTDSGSSTIIESYVFEQTFDLSPFGDNAITSNGNITILGQTGTVQGNVTYVGTISCPGDPDCDATINGTITPEPDGIDYWPSAEEMVNYFLSEVDESDLFHDATIDANDTPIIGPLYREGSLEILSSVKDAITTLNGTVYVTGDLDIGGAKDFTLKLNDQTIFVKGSITMADKVTVEGMGAIIALGDIFFGPKIKTAAKSFLFLMSVQGWIDLHPKNDFYGAIAGNATIDVFPGVNIEWVDPEIVGFEFPKAEYMVRILTYDIK